MHFFPLINEIYLLKKKKTQNKKQKWRDTTRRIEEREKNESQSKDRRQPMAIRKGRQVNFGIIVLKSYTFVSPG